MNALSQEVYDLIDVQLETLSFEHSADSGVTITGTYFASVCCGEVETSNVDPVLPYMPATMAGHPLIPQVGDGYGEPGVQAVDENGNPLFENGSPVYTTPPTQAPTGDCYVPDLRVTSVDVSEDLTEIAPSEDDLSKGGKNKTCYRREVTVTWEQDREELPNDETSCNPADWCPYPQFSVQERREIVERAEFKGVVGNSTTVNPITVTLPFPCDQDEGPALSFQSSVNGTPTNATVTAQETPSVGDHVYEVTVTDIGSPAIVVFTRSCGGEAISNYVWRYGPDDCCADTPFTAAGGKPIILKDDNTGVSVGSCVAPINSCGQPLNYDEPVYDAILTFPHYVPLTAGNAIDLVYPYRQIGKCNASDITVLIPCACAAYFFPQGTLLLKSCPYQVKTIRCNGEKLCYLEASYSFVYRRDGFDRRFANYGYFMRAKPGGCDNSGGTFPTNQAEFDDEFRKGQPRCLKFKDVNGQPIKRYVDNEGQPTEEGVMTEVVYGKCATDFTDNRLLFEQTSRIQIVGGAV